MPPSAQQIVGQLQSLLDGESASPDYVRLRIGIFEAQVIALEELVDRPALSTPETSQQPSPALQPGDVPWDPGAGLRLFRSILAVWEEFGKARAEMTRLRSAVERQPALLEGLMRSAAFAPGERDPDEPPPELSAERWQVSAELLHFLGRLLAAPFVTRAARALHQAGNVPAASDGPCPVCGSVPALASLRAEDGGRVLHCSLCGHAWPFARLVCPFCGNDEQSALSRLSIEGEDARWIEACDRCRQYLKTVDLRRLPEGQEFIPLVEETGGLYLDLVAGKEGYLGGPPYAAVG
jgi:FdhE protein